MNSPKRPLASKIILVLVSTMTVMAGSIVAGTVEELANVLGVPGDENNLLPKMILALPALFIIIASPIAGWIIDRIGRIQLLYFSMILYAVAGTSGLYLDNIYTILIGRAFLGIAVGGILTTSTTLIGDYFAGEEREKFMGLQGAFMTIGGIVYLNLGGWLGDYHWRGPFAVYITSLLLLPFAWKILFEPTIDRSKENRSKVSDFDLPMGQLAIIFTTAFLGMTFFFLVPVQIPFLSERLPEITNAKKAGIISTITVFASISALAYGWVRARLNFQLIFVIVFILMGIGFMTVAYSTTYARMILGLAIAGTGGGLLFPNNNIWIMQIVPEKVRGRMIGFLSMALFLGQFVSPLMAYPITKYYSLDAVFMSSGVFMLFMALWFLVRGLQVRNKQLTTAN